MMEAVTEDRSASAPLGADPEAHLCVAELDKSFTLHEQGGVRIPVMEGARLEARAGSCVALTGVSGAGKSTLIRMIYGNYRAASGEIWVRRFTADGAPEGWLDVARADPHQILELRRVSLGYVSQFLRVIPRIGALDVVADPLRALGWDAEPARERAASLLSKLRIPERLWSLSPLTFSGGEQQRVNIARGFAHPFPTLLLDEPTASLDRANRETVMTMVEERRDAGGAIVGIFHDQEARERLCDAEVDVSLFAAA